VISYTSRGGRPPSCGSAVSAAGAILADEATIWSRRGVPAGLGFLPGLNQSTALGLSGSGYVSGESALWDYAHNIPRAMHAFVWPGHGRLLTLPVPHLSYAHSQSLVHQISDNGTVAGEAGPAHGVMHAYVWGCAFQQAFLPPPPAAQSSGTASPPVLGLRPVGVPRWTALRHIGMPAGH